MKKTIFILFIFATCFKSLAQNSNPDFTWGNAFFYNLNVGETIHFNNADITLLELKNHFNAFKIGEDTLWIKVSRRTLPTVSQGFRILVADNKNVKALTPDTAVHGLLTKDALICLSDFRENLLDPNKYVFPVSFNDGFLWSAEEDSYMFSYQYCENPENKIPPYTYPGIGFDLHDARGLDKHLISAIENSTVVWVEDKNIGNNDKQASVLLESDSQPGIYYVYDHLYNKKVEVKKGQKLVRGEIIGTVWGDEIWGNLEFSVIKSDTVPSFKNRHKNVINIFPQVYELYFRQTSSYLKNYSKGRIRFGLLRSLNGNMKNVAAFENYTGKGWCLGKWNTADKVSWVCRSEEGNARLKKVLFEGTKVECQNPDNYFDYQMNVLNGVYRIRAKVGDMFLPSEQKIEFEGINAGTFSLEAGESKWTTERVVKITDGKLTVRIYVDPENEKVAGLNEIVFQRAY